MGGTGLALPGPLPRPVLDVWTFFEVGGPVLVIIFGTTLLMWGLILERFWFLLRVHPVETARVIEEWNSRSDKASWYAQKIRQMLISQSVQRLERSLPLIRGLVAVSPMLGLLGTVTGMIEVYDVMAIAGSGNARAMAGGVSRAMVTTMAGLVSALSGILLSTRLERRAHEEHDRLITTLLLEDEAPRPDRAEQEASPPASHASRSGR